MDNNFNQQNPMPGQPVYQQNPMPGQPVYQQIPKQPAKINMIEIVSLICSSVGLLMAIIGTLCYCSCSASNVDTTTRIGRYSNSPVMLVSIFGAIVALTGVVLAIVALKQKNATVKAGKMAYVALAVGVFATLYAIIPTITICGYNCSLNNAVEDFYLSLY